MQDFDKLHNVKPGRHLYQFYKSDEDYLDVLIPFFKAGLDKGEACLWLVSEKKNLIALHKAAEKQIPDFLHYVASGQMLIASAEKWYLKNGRFDHEQALKNAGDYIAESIKNGYISIRGSGDGAAIPHEDWELLPPYEDAITEVLRAQPVTALCAYPILDCALKETKMVIEHHDDVLVGHL